MNVKLILVIKAVELFQFWVGANKENEQMNYSNEITEVVAL